MWLTPKQFIRRLSIKIILFTVFMIIMAAVLNSIAPIISNEVAMGQMDHSDEGFIVMNLYNNLRPLLRSVRVVVCIIFGISIGKDVTKFVNYIENNKEN